MLEHHGLNRCMDKGLDGCKIYVGLSVLAYNLHVLGNALKEKKLVEEKRKEKRKLKLAAWGKKRVIKRYNRDTYAKFKRNPRLSIYFL